MKIFDLVRLALTNLSRRLSRTLLTVVGVVIGTACIVIMIAVGLTNLAQFEDMLQSADLTTVTVRGTSEGLESSELGDAAVEAFAALENVKSVIPEISLTFYAETGRYAAPYLPVTAVPADALAELAGIEEGTGLSSGSAMPQIVMGLGAAAYFYETGGDYDYDYEYDYEGPDLNWLDTTPDLYLGGSYTMDQGEYPSPKRYKAEIVGILADTQENHANTDVYMSLSAAQSIIGENHKLADALGLDADTYDTVRVRADTMDHVAAILTAIREYGFEAYSNTEWIEELQAQQQTQQGQLAAIGLISLVVSAIGIANTMMTGILERRKEIGVMKVIGVSVHTIRALYLVESAFIGMIGGGIGILAAHLFGHALVGGSAVNFLGLYFEAGTKLSMPFWLDAGAVGVAMAVGTLAGIFPARRATRMSPLEAIRGG